MTQKTRHNVNVIKNIGFFQKTAKHLKEDGFIKCPKSKGFFDGLKKSYTNQGGDSRIWKVPNRLIRLALNELIMGK